jgi:ribulose-phosphate 3-epimerase
MTRPSLRIAPSLLSADFTDLKGAIAAVERAGVDILHLDVMDGHFVPNITIGPFIIEAIRRVSKSDLDVHLMIENPEKYLERFVRAGSTYVTFHVEATAEARRLVDEARALGVKAGLAINPGTSLQAAAPVLEVADIMVMMTVNPGFGGQSFIADVVPKVRELYELKAARGYGFEIEVDGGIGVDTAPIAAWAGADILVAGAAVYKTVDPAGAVRAIAEAGRRGLALRHDPHAFPLAPA